jgi:uncharacterized paraquat-inducible protein A
MGKASRKKKGHYDDVEGDVDNQNKTAQKKGRTLHCYKCAKEVSEFESSCPHCGAKPPKVNPAVLARVLLGIVLAIIIYIYLM